MTDTPDVSVPDADAYEQQLPALPVDFTPDVAPIAPDVPEADAIEQGLPGPLIDEDDVPR